MSTNEWITDRLPALAEWYVYAKSGAIVPTHEICTGEPWKPIPKCEPYVKPKRYVAEIPTWGNTMPGGWRVRDTKTDTLLNLCMQSRELAVKFEMFLNEVMQ